MITTNKNIYDWKDNPPFLLWMTMNRLDMIVPMGWKLGSYWRNKRPYVEC